MISRQLQASRRDKLIRGFEVFTQCLGLCLLSSLLSIVISWMLIGLLMLLSGK